MPAWTRLPLTDIARIEAAAGRAWPPLRAAPLMGWRLRTSLGGTHRANSVQANRFTGGDPAAAIVAAEAHYSRHGLPCCFQLTPLTRPDGLDARLADRGYDPVTPSWVMLADPPPVGAEAPPEVELFAEPTPAVMAALTEPDWRERDREERRRILGRIGPPGRLALVRRDGRPAAGGRVAVDGPLAGIFAMRTQKPWRGQGLAKLVLMALLAHARAAGAERIYLQVEQDGEAAIALYRRFGFSEAYAYHYRERS
jgi:GNAT superfamily N-acetyltransferase